MNTNEKLIEAIIERLSQGEIPWQKPWASSAPRNLISRKAYTGVNSIPCKALHVPTPNEEIDICVHAICEKLGIAFATGAAEALFSPSNKEVKMPAQAAFKTSNHYYSVLFHELTHACSIATGEKLDAVRRDDAYAKEELVAELGACFLCNEFHLVPEFDNSAGYIQGCLNALQNQPGILISAASKAQVRVNKLLELCGRKRAELRPEETEAEIAVVA